MPPASKAARLPPELKEALIGLWTGHKFSLDQLIEHLHALARGERSALPPELADAPKIAPEEIPGRSGMGEFFKSATAAAEKVKRSRMMAEVFAREIGGGGDEKLARANFELLHIAINDIFMAAAQAQMEGQTEGAEPVTLDPKGAMMLAMALQKTEAARKTHVEIRTQERKVAAAELEQKVKQVEAEVKTKKAMTPEEALERVRKLYRGEE